MDTETRLDIAALIARRQRGYNLERPFYSSPEIYDLDLDVIFARNWVFVASEPELPEPGDYVALDLGRYPIVLVRDDDMSIRAFHNVCRHRGAKLVSDKKGFVGNLVCPYHRWTYDLTGALVHAESVPDGFDASCHGLKPVHLRSLAGLLYVCVGDQAPGDFAEIEQRVAPYLAPHRLSDCKVAAQTDLIEPGNWKLTMENNRECYHCGGHPELGQSLFTFFGIDPGAVAPAQQAYYDTYQRALNEFRTIWDQTGLPWEPIEELHGRPTGFRCERLPVDRAGESYTIDTRVASRRLLGDFTQARLGGMHLHTQPNAWFHFLSDHVVTFAALPLAPDKTLVRTTWLVHRDAIEGVDYDLDNLTKVWRKTNEQDSAFVALAQSGTTSPAYQPGPYVPSEYQVDHFVTWYIERLEAALKA